MKFLVFACGICWLPLNGCGDGKIICETHDDTYCQEGVTYWVDSCGELEEVFEQCPDGCNAAHTGCLGSCTPQCTGMCCGDDGCGNTCPDACSATGQTCNQSTCQCEGGCNPQSCVELGKECGQWDDGCGTLLTCGPCNAGETCDAAGLCQASNLPHFSFFVTSLAAMRELSNSQDGFGGDLTYGETGSRAGLDGADKICAEIAERSMPGSSAKQWRAFLSTSYENAIDRIGDGPWYDRLGRLLANNKSELLNDRPLNADAEIKNDLPNEDGVPNHRPDPTQPEEDNHHMLTGSDQSGELYSSSATCRDWTTADGSSANGSPRCGLSWPRGTGGRGTNWLSEINAPGCAPGVSIIQSGGAPPGDDTVGGGGGYGGFYCFALEP